MKLLEKLNKELEEVKKEKYDLKSQMEALAHDLQGVSIIVGLLSQTRDYSNTRAIDASFGVVSKSIDDIVASMEATVNSDSFYIN